MKDGKKYTFYFVIFLAVLLVPFAGMLITGPSKSESSSAARLPATEIEGDPVGVKELEGASIKTSSVNGYTTVTGTLKEGTYADNTIIYVSVGGRWYEAYPFRDNGKECFQLYVEEFPEGTEIRVAGSL